MSIVEFIRAMPKVELHVHLEGAIRPATLLELARRNNVRLPATTLPELRAFYRFTDFAHFIETYGFLINCLRTPDDFALIAEEFGATMAEQQIRYAEITWSPVSHVQRLGLPFGDLLDGVNRGRIVARNKYGVEMRWIVDIVRNSYAHGVDGMETAEMAIEGRGDGVVALGLGGLEQGFGPELFVAPFAHARAHGLHAIPHAGEAVGPESIWGALRLLGAERIGHGIRAIDDPELVTYLRDQRIPLEISPTSNVCTGVVASVADHPIRRLFDAGVIVTVNSDDPPMFNTTLTDEYLLLVREFGFTLDEIEQLALNAVRATLLDNAEQHRMEQEFRAEFVRLKRAFGL
jgi:adenosine deaminase